MSSRTKIIIAIVTLLIVGGVAGALALRAAGPGVEVEVAEVAERDLAVTVTASGRVESGVRADVYPPTAGTLVEVTVEDGQAVKKGDILAEMDRRPLEIAVTQAEAGVAQAEAQIAGFDKQEPSNADVASARAGADAAWAQYQAAIAALANVGDQAPTSSDIAAASAARRVAEANYELARDAYNAIKAQYEATTTPAPSLEASLTAAQIAKDQAEAGYFQAKSAEEKLRGFDVSVARAQAEAGAAQAFAAYEAARSQQAKLESTSFSVERNAAQEGLDQARVGLATAQENLVDATLRAPIDGVVLFNPLGTPASDGTVPKAMAGSGVAPQAPPFTVVDLGGLQFTAEVDEVDVGRIERDMDADVVLDAFSGDVFTTKVAEIVPASQLTATGGTVFPVYLKLADTDKNVLIGMKGDATIKLSAVPQAATIPIEALFDEGGETYVYVVGGGDVLQRTPVEVGTLTETEVEITSGVQPGDTVAMSGATELVDGLKIKPAE